jgi:hypothetical protein
MSGFIFRCPHSSLQSDVFDTEEEAEQAIIEHIDEHVESAAYRAFIREERAEYTLEKIVEQMREEWQADMSVCKVDHPLF